MANYFCKTKCYYLNKVWEVGEPLPDEVPPNKHFTTNQKDLMKERKPIYSAGDDPRPTKQIIADIKERYGIELKSNTPRKKAFAIWRENSESNSIESDTEETGIIDRGEQLALSQIGQPEFENDILNKRFLEMTPDDIDAITAKEICSKLKNAPYNLHDVKPVGISKADLVKRGCQLEENEMISRQ